MEYIFHYGIHIQISFYFDVRAEIQNGPADAGPEVRDWEVLTAGDAVMNHCGGARNEEATTRSCCIGAHVHICVC